MDPFVIGLVALSGILHVAWNVRLKTAGDPLRAATIGMVAASFGIIPAGVDKAVGVITTAYLKDPTDEQWSKDAGYQGWLDWMKKYYADGDMKDVNNVYGYCSAQTLVQTLKQCGNDLSRENIMRQATALDMTLPLLLPGVHIRTSPTNYYPIRQFQLARFDGSRWALFGDVISD